MRTCSSLLVCSSTVVQLGFDESLLGVCQVRVPGFEFIGCGEARSKKDAQGIAAKMFCQFLVEQGLIDPSTLPAPLDGVSQTSLWLLASKQILSLAPPPSPPTTCMQVLYGVAGCA